VNLGTPDVDQAKRFYNVVFGWEFDDDTTDTGLIWTAILGRLPVAGISPVRDIGTSQGWITYFAVDDADQVVSKIGESGGTVLGQPSDVEGTGRLAVAADPTGVEFGLWQAGARFGAALVNEHGGLNWNELITDDTDRAITFYQRVLGAEAEITEEGDGSSYTTLKVGGRGVAGARSKPRPELPNHWNVYFAIDDTAAAIDRIVGAGGTVLYGPTDVDGVGVFAGFRDPMGADFMVVQLALEID
jgi:predicted enzyme related to lactoylglutathione lyase